MEELFSNLNHAVEGSLAVAITASFVWGVLSVASGGVLLVQSDAGITEVVVPVPPEAVEPPTSGEGWQLELAEGWSIEPGQRPGDWILVKR